MPAPELARSLGLALLSAVLLGFALFSLPAPERAEFAAAPARPPIAVLRALDNATVPFDGGAAPTDNASDNGSWNLPAERNDTARRNETSASESAPNNGSWAALLSPLPENANASLPLSSRGPFLTIQTGTMPGNGKGIGHTHWEVFSCLALAAAFPPLRDLAPGRRTAVVPPAVKCGHGVGCRCGDIYRLQETVPGREFGVTREAVEAAVESGELREVPLPGPFNNGKKFGEALAELFAREANETKGGGALVLRAVELNPWSSCTQNVPEAEMDAYMGQLPPMEHEFYRLARRWPTRLGCEFGSRSDAANGTAGGAAGKLAIAAHVRRGDYKSNKGQKLTGNAWFAEALEHAVRWAFRIPYNDTGRFPDSMADRVEIRIFTDGTLEEVSPIVARFPARMVRILSRDHPSPPPNASANATEEWKLDHDAVSALHNLASADVLVAQQSSFSQPTLAISPAQIRFRPGGRLSSIRSAVTVPQGTGAQMERVWDLLDLRWRDYLKALKEDAGRWAGEWDCPMGRARNWDGGGFGIPL